MGALMKIGPSQ